MNHAKAAMKQAHMIASGLDKKQRMKALTKWKQHVLALLKGEK